MSKPFLYQYGTNFYYVFLNPKTNKRSRLSCSTGDYNDALKYITSDDFKKRYRELTEGNQPVQGSKPFANEIKRYRISDLSPEMQSWSFTNHKRDSQKHYKKMFLYLTAKCFY